MDASTYWKYQMIIAGTMGLLFGIGFQQGNMILVVSALVVGILSIMYFRRSVEEPLYDERSSTVSLKASAASFSTFTVGSLAVAGIFFYLGSTTNPEYFQWAYALTWIVIANMVLRLFFWIYYTRRYGG
jgi:uncharacterized membrane protein